MVSAYDLSVYIIQCANERNIPISHLKLQKILYYVQGSYLSEFGKPLFEEDIEAWPYGPVVRDVYYRYVQFGALNLKVTELNHRLDVTEKELICIKNVIDKKLPLSASALVEASHSEDPWLQQKDKVDCGMKPIIPIERIYRYFSGVRND